jgi:pimeloyl-ACP methyl ester carboxylesterase
MCRNTLARRYEFNAMLHTIACIRSSAVASSDVDSDDRAPLPGSATAACGPWLGLARRVRRMQRPPATGVTAMIHHRTVTIDDSTIFYRQAGDERAPAVLLLHGFPTSSHMFRELIPRLSDGYRVVAPDLPGFGFSSAPDRSSFRYTFDHLTCVIDRFTEALSLDRYAVYVFDYGAPIGFRLAVAHPERVLAIVSQNGNAYEEGLSTSAWDPIQRYWREPSTEHREALRSMLTPGATKWQYIHGVRDETLVAPESYTLDAELLARKGRDELQLDLFLDYASNVALYPTFQAYFRSKKPPLLAAWGQNDPFFLPAGARAFQRDNPNAEVHLYDTGHFALETHVDGIARAMRTFLERTLEGRSPTVLS